MATAGLTVTVPRSFSEGDRQESRLLLTRYQENRCPRLRNRLFALNVGLVKREVAYWLQQNAESYDDLFQVGALGLLGAIERFADERGCAFSSFATRCIRGEIQHYLRDKRYTVRIPRRWQELYERARHVARRWRTDYGREPNAVELAAALGIAPAEWGEIELAHRNRLPMSLDAPTHPDEPGTSLLEGLADRQEAAGTQETCLLEQALATLEGRTREVLTYVFLADWKQRDVAAHYGVSAVTVSRYVKKGLGQLRSVLAA
ncbi:MAG: sigma-70 family RNA polymerase sigma factor [Oscillatoriales cyanobacterium SM2_1_8]|nr:sigma-70 family RNA polymerase sigma factor [Oscillatoriales cyanobacterium SM2_1_8]